MSSATKKQTFQETADRSTDGGVQGGWRGAAWKSEEEECSGERAGRSEGAFLRERAGGERDKEGGGRGFGELRARRAGVLKKGRRCFFGKSERTGWVR